MANILEDMLDTHLQPMAEIIRSNPDITLGALWQQTLNQKGADAKELLYLLRSQFPHPNETTTLAGMQIGETLLIDVELRVFLDRSFLGIANNQLGADHVFVSGNFDSISVQPLQ